ncbi:MAG: response regulator [Planctomycetota bacterium]
MTLPLRIVVADDEADTREYLVRVLPRFGHEVVGVAADGDALLALCDAAEPDLVVTDRVMPGLSGEEAVERLWGRRPVPVVMISAFDRSERLDEVCPETTRLVHLAKPFGGEDLAAAIEDASGMTASTG